MRDIRGLTSPRSDLINTWGELQMGEKLNLNSFTSNFLGKAPNWYKKVIVGFLLFNPLVLVLGQSTPFSEHVPFFLGWCLILEFIFCLAMALKCYPLQPLFKKMLQYLPNPLFKKNVTCCTPSSKKRSLLNPLFKKNVTC